MRVGFRFRACALRVRHTLGDQIAAGWADERGVRGGGLGGCSHAERRRDFP